MLTDLHNRRIEYVRLAVTDRCNLRCTYCMPEQMRFREKEALLSFGEIGRLMGLLADAGVHRVRITGGEPFLRKDLPTLLATLSSRFDVSITTNGVLTAAFVPQLHASGIRRINLSLDTLQAERFTRITRRPQFEQVMRTLDALLAHGMEVRLNTVVMAGVNTDELEDFVALTADKAIAVRFIEEMPFNGHGGEFSGIAWDYRRILGSLEKRYALEKIPDPPGSTAMNYRIPGHAGLVGLIPAFSRTFCGTCNRLRITPTGGVKTCLYGTDALNLRDLMRAGASDAELMAALQHAVAGKPRDGHAAAAANVARLHESMSAIGG